MVVNPSTRGFLLSGVLRVNWYEAVTCAFRMKKAQRAGQITRAVLVLQLREAG